MVSGAGLAALWVLQIAALVDFLSTSPPVDLLRFFGAVEEVRGVRHRGPMLGRALPVEEWPRAKNLKTCISPG